MSLKGVVLQLAYRLRRHLWLGWSLARWLGALLVCAGLLVLIRWTLYLWVAVATGGVLLVYIAVLVLAARWGFVHFEPMPQMQSLLRETEPVPPLRPEELVPIRASGWFTVEGRDQYYVDLEADFETVQTREHIILARVHPSRFLLLGRWPTFELGWWYMFFQPATIQEMALGHLHFGPRPRLTLRLIYAPDEKTEQTIYLTFGDTSVLRRVWEDLQLDAPPGVTA